MLLLGSHVSAAGGVDKAIDRAMVLDMAAFQVFTKNANQWNAKPLDPKVVERFREGLLAVGSPPVVAHDSYLINIASPDPATWEKSRLALLIELDRCDELGIPGLVSHPGAHMGSGPEEGIKRVGEAINRIYAERPDGKTHLLLETTAGQGTTLGRTFEEIAAMLELVEDQSRIGVCVDTCHLFAAGYDLRTEESYDSTMRQLDEIVGIHRVEAVHLNDSKKGLGSRVDRHTHIGEGELGKEPFRFLLNDSRFEGLPGILETPKENDVEDDRRNLATLKSLATPVTESDVPS
jgi:deoxyribonuclease IV